MPRAVGMALEPVEYLVLDVGRNPRTGIGHVENDAVLGSPGAETDTGILRREPDGVCQEIIQHLHHPAFVADKTADVGIDVDLELDTVGGEPVLDLSLIHISEPTRRTP